MSTQTSIIIRTCGNRPLLLRRAMQSACQQEGADIEIVVVEDGSSLSEKLIDELRREYPQLNIRYIATEKLGRSGAANIGVSNATGMYIGFLDDDDLLYSLHVVRLVEVLKNERECRVVFAASHKVDSESDDNELENLMTEGSEVTGRHPYSRHLLWAKNYLSIQSVLLEKSLYESVGGMREDMDMFEDWELWLRCSAVTDFVHVPEITSLYRAPSSSHALIEKQAEFASWMEKVDRTKSELLSDMPACERSEFLAEVSKFNSLLGVSTVKIRRILLKYKILQPLYKFGSRLVLSMQASRIK